MLKLYIAEMNKWRLRSRSILFRPDGLKGSISMYFHVVLALLNYLLQMALNEFLRIFFKDISTADAKQIINEGFVPRFELFIA